MVDFYQIFFKNEHIPHLYPFSQVYWNHTLTIFFENDPISKIVMRSNADKIAVCSWRIKEKLRYNVGGRGVIDEELLNSDYDVLSFTRNSVYHQMLNAAENWHSGFKKALTQIVEGIGEDMVGEVKNPIYQNHFCAKREIYQDYVKNWLIPAMELIKNDPAVYKACTADSNYHKLIRAEALTPEQLQEKIGMPHYPLVPFLLERLFSIYVDTNKINVTWL